jgi:hypothetical protein
VSQARLRQTSGQGFDSSSVGSGLLELRVLWQEYECFSRDLFVQAELALNAKKKEMDMFEFAEVRARGQLDLVRDQLMQVERKLASLIEEMEAA